MKRNNCIQNIKNQINAKINAHTNSERDYIVFRPKSYLFNPILSRQNNNMTSIFQLENKRKNQTFLLKIRCKTKQMQQNSIQVDDHLHIQRCKTFKKFKTNKDKYQTTLQPVKSSTPRQKLAKQQIQAWHNLKKTISSRTEKKLKHSLLSVIQKKKKMDSLLLNQQKNNISYQQKQNICGSININRLRPCNSHEEIVDMLQFNVIKQNAFEKDRIRAFIKRDRQTHKRINTQIPALFLMKLNQQKYGKPSKLQRSFDKFDRKDYQQKRKRKEDNFVFRPWQTSEIFEKQEQEFEEEFLQTR